MAKPKLGVGSSLWLTVDGQNLCGPGRIELLERIEDTGSIRQATIAMGMSYRAAWDAVDLMGRRSGLTLVSRRTGGTGGGGAGLSAEGRALIQLYRKLEKRHLRHLARLSDGLGPQLTAEIKAASSPAPASRRRRSG